MVDENVAGPSDVAGVAGPEPEGLKTGTKFGCRMALSGAFTVHIDGAPTRSCVTSVDSIGTSEITAIEAIGATAAGAKIQKAWLDLEVVQCGVGPDHVGFGAAREQPTSDRFPISTRRCQPNSAAENAGQGGIAMSATLHPDAVAAGDAPCVGEPIATGYVYGKLFHRRGRRARVP
jgi:hypothetical protein